MKMIAAIAVIRGYDLKSDQVQTFVYASLNGTTVSDIMKGTGIKISEKFATGMIKKLQAQLLQKLIRGLVLGY